MDFRGLWPSSGKKEGGSMSKRMRRMAGKVIRILNRHRQFLTMVGLALSFERRLVLRPSTSTGLPWETPLQT